VFAEGDGLETNQGLVNSAITRPADGSVLLLQLNRRVVVAGRGALPALRVALGTPAGLSAAA
jgi:hypothetical protein